MPLPINYREIIENDIINRGNIPQQQKNDLDGPTIDRFINNLANTIQIMLYNNENQNINITSKNREHLKEFINFIDYFNMPIEKLIFSDPQRSQEIITSVIDLYAKKNKLPRIRPMANRLNDRIDLEFNNAINNDSLSNDLYELTLDVEPVKKKKGYRKYNYRQEFTANNNNDTTYLPDLPEEKYSKEDNLKNFISPTPSDTIATHKKTNTLSVPGVRQYLENVYATAGNNDESISSGMYNIVNTKGATPSIEDLTSTDNKVILKITEFSTSASEVFGPGTTNKTKSYNTAGLFNTPGQDEQPKKEPALSIDIDNT